MKHFIMTFIGVSFFFAAMSIPVVNVAVVASIGVGMVIGAIRYIKAQM
jgi:hypothetical protein